MLASLFFAPPAAVPEVAAAAPVGPAPPVVGDGPGRGRGPPHAGRGRGRGRARGRFGGRQRGFAQPDIVKERIRAKALQRSRSRAVAFVGSFVDAASAAEIVDVSCRP